MYKLNYKPNYINLEPDIEKHLPYQNSFIRGKNNLYMQNAHNK